MFKAEAKAEAEENLKALKGRSSSKGVQPLEGGRGRRAERKRLRLRLRLRLRRREKN